MVIITIFLLASVIKTSETTQLNSTLTCPAHFHQIWTNPHQKTFECIQNIHQQFPPNPPLNPTQKRPSCQIGYHWIWINVYNRLGLCAKDDNRSCIEYKDDQGECQKCQDDYVLLRSSQYYSYCAYIGLQEKSIIEQIQDENQNEFDISQPQEKQNQQINMNRYLFWSDGETISEQVGQCMPGFAWEWIWASQGLGNCVPYYQSVLCPHGFYFSHLTRTCIRNPPPDCEQGMHWHWVDITVDGKCVRDLQTDCFIYTEKTGTCNDCKDGYYLQQNKDYSRKCAIIGWSWGVIIMIVGCGALIGFLLITFANVLWKFICCIWNDIIWKFLCCIGAVFLFMFKLIFSFIRIIWQNVTSCFCLCRKKKSCTYKPYTYPKPFYFKREEPVRIDRFQDLDCDALIDDHRLLQMPNIGHRVNQRPNLNGQNFVVQGRDQSMGCVLVGGAGVYDGGYINGDVLFENRGNHGGFGDHGFVDGVYVDGGYNNGGYDNGGYDNGGYDDGGYEDGGDW